jgi:hypothetical protein
MPWGPEDASRHTKKARTPKSKRAFAHAANSVLERTGDEGRAVRAGNAAAKRSAHKGGRKMKRSTRR